jgi:hypothetical protein
VRQRLPSISDIVRCESTGYAACSSEGFAPWVAASLPEEDPCGSLASDVTPHAMVLDGDAANRFLAIMADPDAGPSPHLIELASKYAR